MCGTELTSSSSILVVSHMFHHIIHLLCLAIPLLFPIAVFCQHKRVVRRPVSARSTSTLRTCGAALLSTASCWQQSWSLQLAVSDEPATDSLSSSTEEPSLLSLPGTAHCGHCLVVTCKAGTPSCQMCQPRTEFPLFSYVVFVGL